MNLLENKLTYNEAKIIIKSNNIKTKHDYYKLCEKDIRIPKEPEVYFKDTFKGWIDYLDIERIYYDLETCKNKISEYLNNIENDYLNINNICYKLCEIDSNFPPWDLWCEYYNVKDLSNIIIIKIGKKINIMI
jgi:hypothetical protein